MPPLPKEQRRLLETTVVAARDAAEDAARAALRALSVDRDEAHLGISDEDRALRVALRAQVRQLGDFELLVAQVAYEQWHRMLFARFLAENDLLIHPSGVPVTLQECADLAPAEGEPDGWLLAARYAARMLPGIFPLEDPSTRVRFAREGAAALEQLLAGLPAELFRADDSLGWVYQFWQTKKKKEVNASGRKIGGADIAPVTQLFTEHYMVAFLLENSLGAWWAARHPESPLLKDFQYLRFAEDGTPAAGSFEGWPERAAEVTMMDPCTGSAHFLVTGFHMMRRMREEEEGLSTREAADAVLRDNLFGLEIDGRCVQIAVFALALEAWKVGGYRELPPMNIACSGIPARGTVEEWRNLAQGDQRLEEALERLFHLFKDADTLGSFIDPRRAAEADTLLGVDYEQIAPLLHEALERFGGDDPAQQVCARAAEEVATAARLLASNYTLVATNPPFLQASKQTDALARGARLVSEGESGDLATAFMSQCVSLASPSGCIAMVAPSKWRFLGNCQVLRRWVLDGIRIDLVAELGVRSFRTPMFDLAVGLHVLSSIPPKKDHRLVGIDVTNAGDSDGKAALLTIAPLLLSGQLAQRENADSRILLGFATDLEGAPGMTAGCSLLSEYADSYEGIGAGDLVRFARRFWELPAKNSDWDWLRSTALSQGRPSGLSQLIHWENGEGAMVKLAEVLESRPRRGHFAWGHDGLAINRMGDLFADRYSGEIFDSNIAAVVPKEQAHLPAIMCFVASEGYAKAVRVIDPSLKVTNHTLLKVPFDLDHWTKVAAEQYPDGLPEPHSDDPTQWLFKGTVVGSEAPMHVAVARLLGYSWPDQEPDDLDRLADADGIVCLSPVGGERPAADRLRELLAAAYGADWSESLLDRLLKGVGATDLEGWLRDGFFASHTKLFHNRPFIWQVWDGRKDGFSALLNYHKLDKQGLEKLTYNTLQWWIDRQRAEADSGVAGAPPRLAAARGLQDKLAAILAGEPPLDIYVRWKPLEQQPIGWEPDLDDGVRLNIRPFVEAGVLRSKLTINWNKDRGKNPDGSERHNDLHCTVAQKLEARRAAGIA